jgi:hypothetical protein
MQARLILNCELLKISRHLRPDWVRHPQQSNLRHVMSMPMVSRDPKLKVWLCIWWKESRDRPRLGAIFL